MLPEALHQVVRVFDGFDWSAPQLDRPPPLNGSKVIYYSTGYGESSRLYDMGYSESVLQVRAATEPVVQWVLSLYPLHHLVKGEISLLPAGVVQGVHVDPRVFHRVARRVHVVMVTNPEAWLEIGDVRHHLPAFAVVEFNNLKPHRSLNLGTSDRIHIILDLLPDSCTIDRARLFETVPPEWRVNTA